jgi:hypothetical protein
VGGQGQEVTVAPCMEWNGIEHISRFEVKECSGYFENSDSSVICHIPMQNSKRRSQIISLRTYFTLKFSNVG